jgi:hypothetical protein
MSRLRCAWIPRTQVFPGHKARVALPRTSMTRFRRIRALPAPRPHREHRRATPALGRTRVTSTSPPRPSDSSSTDSITVYSTPSIRRHTLVVRTPSPS